MSISQTSAAAEARILSVSFIEVFTRKLKAELMKEAEKSVDSVIAEVLDAMRPVIELRHRLLEGDLSLNVIIRKGESE